MQINNVSFGARLVMDKATAAFIEKQGNKNGEESDFYREIRQLGSNNDVVEIKNLTKHRDSTLLKDACWANGASNPNTVYLTKPTTTKYSADVSINGTLNKFNINVNKSLPIWETAPLKQLSSLIANEFYGEEFSVNQINEYNS